jgi:hypothetical protein
MKRFIRRLLKAVNIYPLFEGGRSWKWGRADEPRLWVHWSNENEQPGGRYGSILRNGQAWIHCGENCLGWQWVLGKWGLGVGLTVDLYGGEHELSGHAYLPGVRAYWSLDRAIPQRFRQKVSAWWKRRWGYDGRDLQCDVHHDGLWVKVWAPENGWESTQPRWMDWHFDPADFFLGRPKHSSRVLRVEEAEVPLPEGLYPATITFDEATWKRPRWPFVKRRLGADVKLFKPIPVPGKGENSWDCGEDAFYSIGCCATTVAEAIGAAVAAAMRDRERYGGGVDWRPREETNAA